LPVEGISLQTQLTRNLGPIDSWLQYLPVSEALFAAKKGHVAAVSSSFGSGSGSLSSSSSSLLEEQHVVVGTLAEPLALKFNMLHFTPVQTLGGSESCYSLKDQHCLSYNMFTGNKAVVAATVNVLQAVETSSSSSSSTLLQMAKGDIQFEHKIQSHPFIEGAKSAVLRAMVLALESHHACLSMVDVVLNHTSTDSPWLQTHPEAAFSLRNSPHLRAAFELDEAILRVSRVIRQGEVGNVSPYMKDEGCVNTVVDVLQYHSTLGIPASRLWEFYVIDVEGSIASLIAQLVHGVEIVEKMTNKSTPTRGIEISLESLSSLTQEKDNRPCGSFLSTPPIDLETANVISQEMSIERRLEIAASRNSVISSILQFSRDQGLLRNTNDRGEKGGEYRTDLLVSDAQLSDLAKKLCEQPPPPPIEEAVRRLQAHAASRSPKHSSTTSSTSKHVKKSSTEKMSVDTVIKDKISINSSSASISGIDEHSSS
jgi:hypothetical protein